MYKSISPITKMIRTTLIMGVTYCAIFILIINTSHAKDKYEKPTGTNNVDNKSTSGSVPSLNKEISQFITAKIKSGQIQDASVYIRPLSSAEFVDIHPKSTYNPGSLMKVPMLMTFLKMAETNPGLLDKTVMVQQNDITPVPQTFATASIAAGRQYSIKGLLQFMICYSDNNATQVLSKYMNINVTNKIFTDLGLVPPPNNENYFKYTLSPKEYSKFIETLYSSSYLGTQASEYAMSLLAACSFKEGLLNGLPKNTRVIHKFGEAGSGAIRELHESGIVYISNKPYIITVMTMGRDIKKQCQIISQISHMAYKELSIGS